MLVTLDELKDITKDLQLVCKRCCNGYNGKLYNLKEYYGPHGIGFTVEHDGTVMYYVLKNTKISKDVYNGKYDVMSAVLNAGIVKIFNYNGHGVVPTWELTLNTITGKSTYKHILDYHNSAVGGNLVSICWRGQIDEKTLRLRIRRIMKNAIINGKAVLS